MESSMKTDLSQDEIKKLEDVLVNFKESWEKQQTERAANWRLHFLISIFFALLMSITIPSFWWLNIIAIGYFAGSLYIMLRQGVKTNQQIIEHQKQLRLVRLLRRFEASPFSDSRSKE